MIETPRLILRRWQLDDAEDMYEYAKNPNVGPNAGWKPHESVEESREIIKKFLEGNEWAIVDKDTNKVIGSLGVMKDYKRPIETAFSIGYVLSEDYWGKGLMTEIVKAIIPYVFEDLKAESLSVGHFSFNDKSRRVIEKCGFTYEGTYRRAYPVYSGEIYDELNYSMLKEEYEALKKEGFFK